MLLDDLTAVIAVKNRNVNIAYCIASIAQRTDFPKCIVVDFGSEPPLHWDNAPWLKVIRVTNSTLTFHKSRALNIGLRSVTTKFVLFTDADQIFAPNFFTDVHELLSSNPNLLVKCYTNFLAAVPPNVLPSSVMSYYDSLLTAAKKNSKFLGEGCCFGCTVENVLRINGFDERYINWGYEDCDFAHRMELIGCKRKFIHDKTTMVHLPHQENWSGHVANHDLYRECQAIGKTVANENIEWGKP